MSSSIGIGVAGASGAFGRFIAEAVEEMGEGRITAISGRDPERTERGARELGAPAWYTDYDRFVADPSTELVVISTPPSSHASMGIAAARAGKAVFMEKPVATSVADAHALVSAVREGNVAGTVDFVMRYNPIFQTLKKWIDEGFFGGLHYVDFHNFAADEALAPDHWFWDRDLSGGILVEHGVHFFDIYGYLVGTPPVHVHGVRTIRPGTDQEDKVLATVTYENGALGTYYHAFDKPSRLERQSAVLGFDRGYVTVDGWIATSLTIDALVDTAQREKLAQTPYLDLETVERYEGDEQQARGNGNAYTVTERVRGTLHLPRSKQDIYRTSVADALRDIVALMRDPMHTPRVTLLDGARAVAIARGATDPHEGARIAETWRDL